jgi:hypothetical protein
VVDHFLSSVFHDAFEASSLLFGAKVECLGIVWSIREENKPIDGHDHGDYTVDDENPVNSNVNNLTA